MNHFLACRAAIALALILPAVAAGAAAAAHQDGQGTKPEIDRFVDPAADFARYKTFSWAPDLVPAKRETFHKLILSAVERALMAKGYTKVTTGRSDLQVTYWTARDTKLKGSTSTPISPAKPSDQQVVTEFGREDEGTLAIELLDGVSRQTVWRAKTHAVLGSRAETAAAIDPLVGRMLESIPKK